MEVSHNRKIGALGEDVACKFLVKRGFTVIERNYKKKWGEIDIIVTKSDCIHFIEVKTVSRAFNKNEINETSANGEFNPGENIHPWKIKRLSRTVSSYLSEKYPKKETEQKWQIDAIIVFLDQDSKQARISFIESIF
jgi:putative endonuclease